MSIGDAPIDSSIARSPDRQQSLNRKPSFGDAGLGCRHRREGGSLTPHSYRGVITIPVRKLCRMFGVSHRFTFQQR
jgi:hypothetical protein